MNLHPAALNSASKTLADRCRWPRRLALVTAIPGSGLQNLSFAPCGEASAAQHARHTQHSWREDPLYGSPDTEPSSCARHFHSSALQTCTGRTLLPALNAGRGQKLSWVFKQSCQAQAGFVLVDPADFRPLLQEDYEWARTTIPFFASSDQDLTSAYFFRWRVYRC